MITEEEIARAPLLDDDFRKIGFTGAARGLPRDDLAFRMVCAFCGYDPDKAPDALRFFPNESMKAAWGRVLALVQPAIDAAVAGERPGTYFANLLQREWVGPDGIRYEPTRERPADYVEF